MLQVRIRERRQLQRLQVRDPPRGHLQQLQVRGIGRGMGGRGGRGQAEDAGDAGPDDGRRLGRFYHRRMDDALDVGPGAWRVDDWRSKPRAEATPTRQDPATWNRPRRAERRKRTSRSGNALAPCVPVAGTELPQTPACIPAAGTHRGVSAENAFPQRDLLSREPSAGGLQPPAGMGVRMGRLLAARVRHGLQPGYDTARMRRMPSDGCAPQGMCATDATVDAMTPTPA